MVQKYIFFPKFLLLAMVIISPVLATATDNQPAKKTPPGTAVNQTYDRSKAFVGGALFGATSTLTALALTGKNTSPTPSIKSSLTTLTASAFNGFVKGSATTAGIFSIGYAAYQWKGKEALQCVQNDLRSNVHNDVKIATNKAISTTKKRLAWPLSAFIKDEEQDNE